MGTTCPTSPAHAVPTGSEACLLLALAQVAVGVEGALQGGGRLHRLAPALPLNEVGDAALRHGRWLRHMLLHHLRDACEMCPCVSNPWAPRVPSTKPVTLRPSTSCLQPLGTGTPMPSSRVPPRTP